MKKFIFMTIVTTLFLTIGNVNADELPAGVQRLVDSVNVELDKCDDALNRRHLAAYTTYMAGARREYDRIAQYYPDQDLNHPNIAALRQRMKNLESRALALKAEILKRGDVNPNNKINRKLPPGAPKISLPR